jgi:hypothetical protein
MKKAYTLSKTSLLTLLLILSVVFACSDDKKDEDPKPSDNPIVATWQLSGITPETPGTTIPALALIPTLAPCYLDLKIIFNADFSVSTSDCAAAVTVIDSFVPVGSGAKWEVNGDQLTLSRGTTKQTFKFTQTTTTLTVVVNTNTDTTKPAVNALLVFTKK